MTTAEPMRALSCWQPIASLIAHGFITLETRSWKREPGPLAIHASKSRDGLEWCELPAFQAALRQAGLEPKRLPLGALVGVTVVDQVIPVEDWDPSEQSWDSALVDVPLQGWAYLLRDAQALPEPVPVGGHHMMWTVPEPEAAAVRAQLPPRPPSIWEEMRRVEEARAEADRVAAEAALGLRPLSDEELRQLDADLEEMVRRRSEEE